MVERIEISNPLFRTESDKYDFNHKGDMKKLNKRIKSLKKVGNTYTIPSLFQDIEAVAPHLYKHFVEVHGYNFNEESKTKLNELGGFIVKKFGGFPEFRKEDNLGGIIHYVLMNFEVSSSYIERVKNNKEDMVSTIDGYANTLVELGYYYRLLIMLVSKPIEYAQSGKNYKDNSYQSKQYSKEDYQDRNNQLVGFKEIIIDLLPERLKKHKGKICQKVIKMAQDEGVNCPKERQLKRILFS